MSIRSPTRGEDEMSVGFDESTDRVGKKHERASTTVEVERPALEDGQGSSDTYSQKQGGEAGKNAGKCRAN